MTTVSVLPNLVIKSLLLFVVVLSTLDTATSSGSTHSSDRSDDEDGHDVDHRQKRRRLLLEQRLEEAKLDLWARGASCSLDETAWFGTDDVERQVLGMEAWQRRAARQGPVRAARYATYRRRRRRNRRHKEPNEDAWSWLSMPRGGGAGEDRSASSSIISMETKIRQLTERFGSAFAQAIEQNKREHARDCEESCRHFYCAPPNIDDDGGNKTLRDVLGTSETTIRSYSMGAVPPEDFADDFGFPLDLIKVTQGKPLFPQQEARRVVDLAESEGLSDNEYVSGKYKLGGDWLTNLPQTRQWFNGKLQTTLFPLLAYLFPEIVSDVSVLRAHSVSLLKYNASHPRTDVHIDNGILAMTLAMTPQEEYQGGGTFFEHFAVTTTNDKNTAAATTTTTTSPEVTVIPMDVGHATLRPGSVRHGGHRVTQGTRYILGAFLLIEDRVEHVRRLKNRGSDLRSAGNLDGAAMHFEWALALNPMCTTCLKDWAEILHKQKQFDQAEAKIRQALQLLEYKDSDALFTLGLLLSEQGKDEECIEAYRRSLALNSEDAELLYNLGVKIGELPNGDCNEEIQMYKRCIEVDPEGFGGAWLNLGTTLAEGGNLADAETMFLKAMGSSKPFEVKPKAMINLALIYHQKVGEAFQHQNIDDAKSATLQAASYLDTAKPLLDQVAKNDPAISASIQQYVSQYKTLRLACHRNLGQIYAGTGNMALCEEEFRRATESFPTEIKAWQMLGRVLEIQGKKEAMQEVISKIQQLQSFTGGF